MNTAVKCDVVSLNKLHSKCPILVKGAITNIIWLSLRTDWKPLGCLNYLKMYPISAVKTFGKNTCALCNREQMETVKASRITPDMIINSCSEIHGACHHKPRFHRFHEQETHSADDCKKREKVALEAPNPTRGRINLIDPDGNESIGSHSHQGTETCGFIHV